MSFPARKSPSRSSHASANVCAKAALPSRRVVRARSRPRASIAISRRAVALMRDGNQIVAMLGPDIQAGISGFGDATIEALKDLAAQMECEKYRLEGLDF
jgi:hypothetical protein